jgi:hypothetical protein
MMGFRHHYLSFSGFCGDATGACPRQMPVLLLAGAV